jgi:hypothetical protein
MRVEWDKLSSQTYEDMVTVLLSRIHPESQRVDGAGGDGGRDLYFDTPSGRYVFQLKSFTGRMSAVRRRQVSRSLESSARFQLAEWALVVPMDPTPGELKWFESLQERFQFPLIWHGITWLNSEVSSRPEIVSYFLEGYRDEVIALLKELKQEEAALQTVSDAVTRLRVIHSRLNELDPYYRYDFAVSSETSTPPIGVVLAVSIDNASVYVYPRYADAVRDRPITVSVRLAFGPDGRAAQQAFLRAMDYGFSVQVPAEFVTEMSINGPGGVTYTGTGTLALSEAEPLSQEPRLVCAEILDAGRLLSSLPINLRVRHTGSKGGLLDGDDDTHWLKVAIEWNTETKNFSFTFHVEPTPIGPATVLPLLRWLSNFRPPYEIGLRVLGAEEHFGKCPIPLLPIEGIANLVNVYEALDAIQKESGSHFAVPLDLSREEVEAILHAHSLVKGDTIRGSWSSVDFRLASPDPETLRRLLLPEGAQLLVEEEQCLNLRGYKAPLGTIRAHIPSARAADADALIALLASGATDVAVRLIPGSSATVTQQKAR